MITVEFEGKEIQLTDDATIANDNKQEVKENEMYWFEMKAAGICEGKQVNVFWKFWEKQGGEVYYDDLDYYDVNRIEVV